MQRYPVALFVIGMWMNHPLKDESVKICRYRSPTRLYWYAFSVVQTIAYDARDSISHLGHVRRGGINVRNVVDREAKRAPGEQ